MYRQTIQHSLDQIESRLNTELSAEELAKQAGFSLYHYYRIFRMETGMPVMQYILRRKLLHAVYDMSRGMTGIRVAMEYGFETYAGFYRAFVREFGVTPGVYLRSGRAVRPCPVDLSREESIMLTLKQAREILKHWDLEDAPLEEIFRENNGTRVPGALAVGDAYILKVIANAGKVGSHLSLSRALEDTGLAAGAVPTSDGRESVEFEGRTAYLVRRLPGRQIGAGELFAPDTSDGRFVGEMIGQLHLALAEAKADVREEDLLATVRDWALPKAKDILDLTQAQCDRFLEEFAALYPKLPRQIIHRDPNPGNIIRGVEGWAFVDFELAQRNVRLYDPCYAATAVLSEQFGRDNERWLEILQSILAGYDSVVTLTEEERRAVGYVILANQFVCVAWFAEQPEYAGLLQTNAAMTTWLMERFDRLKME